jgi:hypothetical protein
MWHIDRTRDCNVTSGEWTTTRNISFETMSSMEKEATYRKRIELPYQKYDDLASITLKSIAKPVATRLSSYYERSIMY